MEEIAMSDNRDNTGALMGFLLGAAVGAGVALLMAPSSGEETRRRLGESAQKLKSTAGNRLHELKDTAGNRLHDLKDTAGSRLSDIKDKLVERGKDAVHAGRDAYDREMDTDSREPL
jgi:gas vesicle protein